MAQMCPYSWASVQTNTNLAKWGQRFGYVSLGDVRTDMQRVLVFGFEIDHWGDARNGCGSCNEHLAPMSNIGAILM